MPFESAGKRPGDLRCAPRAVVTAVSMWPRPMVFSVGKSAGMTPAATAEISLGKRWSCGCGTGSTRAWKWRRVTRTFPPARSSRTPARPTTPITPPPSARHSPQPVPRPPRRAEQEVAIPGRDLLHRRRTAIVPRTAARRRGGAEGGLAAGPESRLTPTAGEEGSPVYLSRR